MVSETLKVCICPRTLPQISNQVFLCTCSYVRDLGIPGLSTDEMRIAFLSATSSLPVGIQQKIWQEIAYHGVPSDPPPTPKKGRYVRASFADRDYCDHGRPADRIEDILKLLI